MKIEIKLHMAHNKLPISIFDIFYSYPLKKKIQSESFVLGCKVKDIYLKVM